MASTVAPILAAFGVTVTYTRAGGASSSITAAFREASPETAVPGDLTQALVKTSDLPSGAARGDTVTIGAIVYEVGFISPDRDGGTTIDLKKR